MHIITQNSYLVNGLKKYTKQYYNKYIINLSKSLNEIKEKNYIVDDTIKFIIKFFNLHEINLDIENFNKFLYGILGVN